MEKYSSAFSGVYSKAVSEMYSQFKKFEAHPMEKYIGRLAKCNGEEVEVVGYAAWPAGLYSLIVDATQIGGRSGIEPGDFVFKECESYLYVSICDLIDWKL